jgi:DNA polymerase III subunit beta
VATTATVPITGGGEAGVALVSARLLAEIAKTLGNKPVVAHIDGTHVAVTCGTFRFRLPTMPVEDYPTLPEPPPAIGTVDADTFADAVAPVVIAASRDAAQRSLCGVRLAFVADRLSVLASDRYRIAADEIGWTPAGPNVDTVAIVPAGPLADAAQTLAAAGAGTLTEPVTVLLDDNSIGFVGPARSVVIRLMADPYTITTKAFPGRSDTPAQVLVADLTAALRRAELVQPPRTPVRIAFSANTLTVVTVGDADSNEDVSCAYAGPEMSVVARISFLLDGLATLGAPVADMHWHGNPRKPVLLTPGHDDVAGTYRYLFLPIRDDAPPPPGGYTRASMTKRTTEDDDS